MWNPHPTETYEGRAKLFTKKHPRELKAMIANLHLSEENLHVPLPEPKRTAKRKPAKPKRRPALSGVR